MTSPSAVAADAAATAHFARDRVPAIRSTGRVRALGLALATAVAGAALGSAAAASLTGASGQARFESFVERLEHARRVDDLRNQQLRWAQ